MGTRSKVRPRQAKPEDEKTRKARTKHIIKRLQAEFPTSKTALIYANPLELLVATILSAQCTDKRVNMVTNELFKKYRTASDFANADQPTLENEVRSTGFYRNKARSIIGACKSIVEDHAGKVPNTMEKLTSLAGVGRKTANCVLGGAFGINDGIVVDTHVRRLSQRLGLSEENDPFKIELDLIKAVPKNDWYDFSNLLIWHGRKTCTARNPMCNECGLAPLCPSANILSK